MDKREQMVFAMGLDDPVTTQLQVSVVDPDPFDTDPDSAFHFETDLDPAFQFDTDPNPDPTV